MSKQAKVVAAVKDHSSKHSTDNLGKVEGHLQLSEYLPEFRRVTGLIYLKAPFVLVFLCIHLPVLLCRCLITECLEQAINLTIYCLNNIITVCVKFEFKYPHCLIIVIFSFNNFGQNFLLTNILFTSNCTILTMSTPIYAIGEKKPEKKKKKNSGIQQDSNLHEIPVRCSTN